MTIVNMTKLITVRDDLHALATLMEHEPPHGLILDILADAVMHLTDVINTEADTRRDSTPTNGGITMEEAAANTCTLLANIMKELREG